MLCYVMLCYVMLCYVMLCYVKKEWCYGACRDIGAPRTLPVDVIMCVVVNEDKNSVCVKQ